LLNYLLDKLSFDCLRTINGDLLPIPYKVEITFYDNETVNEAIKKDNCFEDQPKNVVYVTENRIYEGNMDNEAFECAREKHSRK